ncbi:DEAD/DEAH box helicase family protein [Pseudomonas sp. WS 5011]|uniref:DEAD/DEAH box helicase family protein n=1 Tax=Pseudomonas sp. WS 5011 TaxID=2717477 RepID=UPI0014752521|nr:DEAD/DEAH box helicase family protein [Pseudomonas sp. WS 5011]NMY53402.1 DEAD/DEAH box helicase family protein [Pseudomonas sp. WS 5011]
MNIDFSKLQTGQNSETALHPRDIFTSLPSKAKGKFQYPRDVQSDVWEQWHQRRNENNLVVKMNTGSGKTVVGLLILKSCLNEKKGPAAFIVPDNYLVEQVINEAKALGLAVTDNCHSPKFLQGKEILVTNIHTLFNGYSAFGVGDQGIKINMGSILIDDAHACLDKIEDQFTITVPSTSNAYKAIYASLRGSLLQQSELRVLELESGDPSIQLLTPFWAWQDNVSEISRALISEKGEDYLNFKWPLIKDSLKLSRCVVSSSKIEISPHNIPINVIPSVEYAARKVFMTATLADDSVLASHFGITDENAYRAIRPSSFSDVGDRMILMPQVINPEISDEDIKSLCSDIKKHLNVVVVVPSGYRAKFWEDCADLILKHQNIESGIQKLKSGHVGLAVLVNRYDGIDLPDDACRLLVIDGMPDVRRMIDKAEEGILMGTDRMLTQMTQRVEQGMGRGIRSNDDYCAVILMGKTLARNLYSGGALDKFSPGTKAQLELSERVASQLEKADLNDIWNTLLYCLNQDPNWVSSSKGALTGLVAAPSRPDPVTMALRKAYDQALVNNPKDIGLNVLNSVAEPNRILRSYLKIRASEYVNLYDKVEAQKLVLSAANDNPRTIKPLDGIQYHKLEGAVLEQARQCKAFLQAFGDPNKPIIELNGVLEDLIFKPETATRFELALSQLAEFVGFTSQRPETESGRGPDVLWRIGASQYLVIECKNGAITETINKHDCNQLNGSGEWFENRYGVECTYVPILIHPSNKFEHAASPKAVTRIMSSAQLDKLIKTVRDFVKTICSQGLINDDAGIRQQLLHYRLRASDLSQGYTTNYLAAK